MPTYIYKNLETGEVKEVVQKMEDEHIYIENGVMFERIFTVPQKPVIDSIFTMNPFDSKGFVEKTGKKSGNLGNLFQLSAELSEKRKSKEGFDKIEEKSFNKYEKERVPGTVHPSRKKRQLKEAVGKLGADITL